MIDNKLFWTNVHKRSTSLDFIIIIIFPFYFHEYIKANNIIRFLRQSAILGHVLIFACIWVNQNTHTHVESPLALHHKIKIDVHMEYFPIYRKVIGKKESQTSHVCNQLLIKYDFYIKKKIAILFVICDPIRSYFRVQSNNNIINIMYCTYR